ncbi:PAS domain-containing sensor histidine kinase [uncultured Pedobacter sp.]|uniref:PAS domain-containing sensor histidine kinase n=1 Tax=uncultured Pedobacter sp. TaxID=246139 RepID=UPI0025DC6A25|nr:PAS domain-containing sensor histidine kinase [uncultured Pedobacter sp.]
MIKSAHLPDLFTLQSIFEGIQDAIYYHDLEFKITNWNPAAERMFGYTATEVLGKSVFLLIPEDRYSEKKKLMQEILNDKRIRQYRTFRLTRSGKKIPVSLTFSPIKDQDGKIIGTSQIAHDISFEHQAEEKQSMLAAIIESSEDAIISKTLDGIITTWNKGELQKMIVLVTDLFDVSKIQSGKLQLNMEQVNLALLVQEMKESFLQAHPEHILKIEMPEESFVHADRMRLEQVLTNLLDNAVKYAPQQKKIELKILHMDKVVHTSVKDFGPGISEENQSYIFGQFYQSKEHRDSSSGLGLGLFISKDIIERHGGQIWVESKPGKGATFNFSLPLV